MEYLEFALSSFWRFAGSIVILSIICTTICFPLRIVFLLYNRHLRHQNILKHGYPPAHCDADGDFKQSETLK